MTDIIEKKNSFGGKNRLILNWNQLKI